MSAFADHCPCCGKSTARTWEDKSLAEMDRSELLDLIGKLQAQFDQVSDQFLRLAQLNQRILSRNSESEADSIERLLKQCMDK